MHRYEEVVLRELERRKGKTDLEALVKLSGLGKDNVLWALQSLKGSGAVDFRTSERERLELTEEGRSYAKDKLPEEQLLDELEKKGAIPIKKLTDPKSQIGLSWAKRNGLIEIVDGNVRPTGNAIKALSEGLEDGNALRTLLNSPERQADILGRRSVVENLVRRKLVKTDSSKVVDEITITKSGVELLKRAKSEEEMIESLDKNIINTRKWKGRKFKPYDVDVPVERQLAAKRHPLRYVMNSVREAYLSMGFQETSSPAIESAFWVFDSLFMPQDHPARDMQDTFYLEEPATVDISDVPYLRMVKKAHEEGWKEAWSKEEASKAVLRTHTTSTSSRYIYRIMREILEGKKHYQLPLKYFSMGRVFRNENLDYRHLADLNMTDGIVIGENLTLANLFDVLIKLYGSMGIKLKFKPSYFPFVEPGAEFFGYSEAKKEWIEMGGSGIIREEITGVSRKRLTVLAWGCGIERIPLILDKSLSSITELYGSDIGWLRNRRLV